MTKKLIYCTHLDQLLWELPDAVNWPFSCELSKDKLNEISNRRYSTAKWVNENCEGYVYAWNRCINPIPGEEGWAKKIVPQGDITLFFTLKEDYANFLLTTDII